MRERHASNSDPDYNTKLEVFSVQSIQLADWIELGLSTPKVVEKVMYFPLLGYKTEVDFDDPEFAATEQGIVSAWGKESRPRLARLEANVLGLAFIGRYGGGDADYAWRIYTAVGPGRVIHYECIMYSPDLMKSIELVVPETMFRPNGNDEAGVLLELHDNFSAAEIVRRLRNCP